MPIFKAKMLALYGQRSQWTLLPDSSPQPMNSTGPGSCYISQARMGSKFEVPLELNTTSSPTWLVTVTRTLGKLCGPFHSPTNNGTQTENPACQWLCPSVEPSQWSHISRKLGMQPCLIQVPNHQVIMAKEPIQPLYTGREVSLEPHSSADYRI